VLDCVGRLDRLLDSTDCPADCRTDRLDCPAECTPARPPAGRTDWLAWLHAGPSGSPGYVPGRLAGLATCRADWLAWLRAGPTGWPDYMPDRLAGLATCRTVWLDYQGWSRHIAAAPIRATAAVLVVL